jgi:hypothetical protein
VNRVNRPNTWLHRPMLQREENPCQPGAVHTWHKADLLKASPDVRFWGEMRTSQALRTHRVITTDDDSDSFTARR